MNISEIVKIMKDLFILMLPAVWVSLSLGILPFILKVFAGKRGTKKDELIKAIRSGDVYVWGPAIDEVDNALPNYATCRNCQRLIKRDLSKCPHCKATQERIDS
jgi:hypothetical protein